VTDVQATWEVIWRYLNGSTSTTLGLRSEASERRTASTRLREFAATEARKIGIAEFARRVEADPSNLRKAINGERQFGLDLQRQLRRYRGGDG
jgi:hypothetical protein